MGTISLALRKPAPVSASWAEDMTASMILQRMWTVPFGVGSGSFSRIGSLGLSLRKKNPPALDLALFSQR